MKVLGVLGAGVSVAAMAALGCASEHKTGPTREGAHPDAVGVDFFAGDNLSSAGSGTLLWANVVLTAAHCADGSTAARVTAPDAAGQSSAVAQILHYDWTRDPAHHSLEHDLALLVLRRPIQTPHYSSI